MAEDQKPSIPFQVNQKVVYPLQGVGQIKDITERTFRGKPSLYYQLYLAVSDMTVMIPVDKAEEVGIRAIVEKSKAQEALEIISKDYEPITADWKMRYQMNLDLLKNGTIMDIAMVVRNLYHRSKIKELPILERKLYDSAMRLLIDEISFSLNLGSKEVENMIHAKLEPISAKVAAIAGDLDEEIGDIPAEEEEDFEE